MDDTRLAGLLRAARIAGPPADAPLSIEGRDPVLATPFAVGEAAALALGLAATAAAELHARRTGVEQEVAVDVAGAAATLLGFLLQRSESAIDLARHQTPATDLYEDRHGRWIHLHGGFPHLAEGLLRHLGCALDRGAISRAVAERCAFELEDELAAAGLCAAAVRSEVEFAAHPQGLALAPLPALSIERIDRPGGGDGPGGEAPAEPPRRPDAPGRPLEGIRVLDLTRVLAGPSCGRTLASHGADVLRVGSPRLPSIEPFVAETGAGKRSAWLDLDAPADLERLRELVRTCDVVCQSYRPGSLARRGLGPADLAALRPGIVVVSVDCWGPVGPWSARPGWEQLAQSGTGLAARQGGEGPPALIPAAATDYTTGALAAAGAIRALVRRTRGGGSHHVHASLARTALWLLRIGADRDPAAASGLGDVAARQVVHDTAWGRLRQLGPIVRMSATPPRWERPPAPLGHHEPTWL